MVNDCSAHEVPIKTCIFQPLPKIDVLHRWKWELLIEAAVRAKCGSVNHEITRPEIATTFVCWGVFQRRSQPCCASCSAFVHEAARANGPSKRREPSRRRDAVIVREYQPAPLSK